MLGKSNFNLSIPSDSSYLQLQINSQNVSDAFFLFQRKKLFLYFTMIIILYLNIQLQKTNLNYLKFVNLSNIPTTKPSHAPIIILPFLNHDYQKKWKETTPPTWPFWPEPPPPSDFQRPPPRLPTAMVRPQFKSFAATPAAQMTFATSSATFTPDSLEGPEL